MLITTSLYLFNLLCAIVPCDPKFGSPEIRSQGVGEHDRVIRTGNIPLVDHTIPPRVTLTSGGDVEGYFMTSVSGKKFFAFEGIPYAQPPTGYNRFRPPVPAKPWNGVFPAKKPGPVCLQLNPLALYRTVGNEDCLTVNVYSSQIPVPGQPKPRLPVLIWIHGGAYLYGSGAIYGPGYLLTQDIVLVSFNYRLGVLGFLSTGSSASPGNNGLKDQVLAIKWVYENIEQFGGNKDQITLMGHSAGAASTHFHMMSNQTQNYFQAAMSLSGSAMNYWALSTPKRALELTNKIAKRMNCPVIRKGHNQKEGSATVNCLRRRNPVFLVSNQMNLLDYGPLPIVLFSPVVEAEGPDAFLTDTPKNLYAQNRVSKIPWITSLTTEEGFFQLQC